MADLEVKYAHLSNRDSPARKANREALRVHIEKIQAEQADSGSFSFMHSPLAILAALVDRPISTLAFSRAEITDHPHSSSRWTGPLTN